MASTSSTSVETSTKRKRVEEDENAQSLPLTPAQYERPVDFWMDDGNIVLQAEETQFRVHRTILCAASSFFNDMFSLPQPQDAPTVEGCPLVNCSGDGAQDWKNMLMLVYHPFRLQRPFPVTYLTSMLRLGKKYHFNLIRDDAVKQLKTCIPSTFGMWHENLSPLSRIPACSPRGYLWLKNQEFDLINIALEAGIVSILPALYYLCAVQIGTDRVFAGIRRTDGTISKLSFDSQRIVILGQSKIRDLIPCQTMDWLVSTTLPDDDCRTPDKCSSERIDLLQSELPDLLLDLRNALNQYNRLQSDADFCSSCSENAETMHEQGRRKIWEQLPLLFGIPKWDDIKDSVD